MRISPIPFQWIQAVTKALESADSKRIEWTLRADTDWGLFGMKYQAYILLIQILNVPGIIGSDESGHMIGAKETWAFLCPHPINPSSYLYAKIGLKDDLVKIKVFSLHVDLMQKKLETAIATYQKKHK